LEVSTKLTIRIITVKYILICLLLAACSLSDQSQSDAAREKMDMSVDSPTAKIDSTATGDSNHYYAVYADGEYGYEQAISQDDINAGKGASPLIMFKYLGENDGVHQVILTDNDGSQVVSECTSPCKYFKASVLNYGYFIRKEMMAAAPGTIGAMVFLDAFQGKLKPYIEVDKSTGIKSRFWFDGQRLIQTKLNAPVESKPSYTPPEEDFSSMIKRRASKDIEVSEPPSQDSATGGVEE